MRHQNLFHKNFGDVEPLSTAFSHFPSHYIGIVNIMLVTHLVGLVPKALAYLVLSPLQPPRIHHCNKNKTKHKLQPTSGLHLIRCITDHLYTIPQIGAITQHGLAAFILKPGLNKRATNLSLYSLPVTGLWSVFTALTWPKQQTFQNTNWRGGKLKNSYHWWLVSSLWELDKRQGQYYHHTRTHCTKTVQLKSLLPT